MAFTFRDQEYQITKDEYDEMFANSEKIVNDAYNRMKISEQPWSQHQTKEVDFLLSEIDSDKIHHVIDFGCGNGRHAIDFARRGFDVLGIDYSERNIQLAMNSAGDCGARFIKGDCRNIVLEEKAELALCLYDVIGSFVDVDNNLAILKNIHQHLHSSGYLVVSVMNLEMTAAIAKHKVDCVQTDLDALVKLPPSRTMQNSGNIFNPDYYLLETSTGVTYRKEQFENDDDLSAEYVIRDKRYTKAEICGLLETAGFHVLEARYVRAGRWNIPLESTDHAAKEILILAEKR